VYDVVLYCDLVYDSRLCLLSFLLNDHRCG